MLSNKEITIIDIPSPGILGGVFSDLILALTHSINLLGFKVSYERRFIRTTNPVIIFGLYREFINNSPQIQFPENYFNFNLVPIIDTKIPWFQNYLQCVSTHNLIDYSYNNISYLSKLMVSSKSIHLFNFGFFDLMPFNGIERSEYYLFYGKLNEVREQRLKYFQNAGLKLNVLQNVWGMKEIFKFEKQKQL